MSDPDLNKLRKILLACLYPPNPYNPICKDCKELKAVQDCYGNGIDWHCKHISKGWKDYIVKDTCPLKMLRKHVLFTELGLDKQQKVRGNVK